MKFLGRYDDLVLTVNVFISSADLEPKRLERVGIQMVVCDFTLVKISKSGVTKLAACLPTP